MFFLAVLLLPSCSGINDENMIFELMENLGRFAERKDTASIMINLADDYHDFEGRNRLETRDMIEEYFKDYKGIVTHVLSTRIDEIRLPEAFIQTEVALSSGAAKVFRKLVHFSTDNYRLKLKLIKKEGAWQIRYAEWTYVSFDELFPESRSIFNRIFKITG
jgi:hypothetical protein